MRGVTEALARSRHAQDISTRTPHAGSDDYKTEKGARVPISTRTPHAGSDPQGPLLRELPAHFNPHSPCGE